jgi:hypothetical protein
MAKNELQPASEDNMSQSNQGYSWLVLVERKSYVQLYAEHRSDRPVWADSNIYYTKNPGSRIANTKDKRGSDCDVEIAEAILNCKALSILEIQLELGIEYRYVVWKSF